MSRSNDPTTSRRFLLIFSPVAMLLLHLALPWTSVSLAEDRDSEPPRKWGHSQHGAIFDEGPRQKPWTMEGIGEAPFPITTSNPEVQKWFNQGNALLHGFWWYEAERSFRWCLKLDPDCAMAYLALARCTWEDDRGGEFLEEAVKRKESVSTRERDYIELFEAKAKIQEAEEKEEARREFAIKLDRLLMEYPDDIEAKALYFLQGSFLATDPRNLGNYRAGQEAILQQILEKNPNHVGALHYRIHNWDGKEGRYAIDSCLHLGDVAPNCGHLLHMPGHVLSGIGLWHEAAIAMDRATRVENTYMNTRMVLPENNWDYIHNLDYLCYIQEQLGMPEMALYGARQLLLAPPPVSAGNFGGAEKIPTFRVLVKYERWDEILSDRTIQWNLENPIEAFFAGYARSRALLGTGKHKEAAQAIDTLREKKKAMFTRAPSGPPKKVDPEDKDPGNRKPPATDKNSQAPDNPRIAYFMNRMTKLIEARILELEARLELAIGDRLTGIEILTRAARQQEENWQNDPPVDPCYLYNVLGEVYLSMGCAQLAADSFEKTLETVFHDGFALSGLVRAYADLGDVEKAKKALSALLVVWSDADRTNRWLDAALKTGIEAEPYLESPVEQRNYRRQVLDNQGPNAYVPADAPTLSAKNSKGERVTFDDFEGKNVLLIFYLGDECLHCVEQIEEANRRWETFRNQDTVIVAVSKDSTQKLAEYDESGEFHMTLLSDPSFENAKRFKSYDDFEEIELHSTLLIDKQRRVHWVRTGGDPFMDFDYLEREVKRLSRDEPPATQSQPSD